MMSTPAVFCAPAITATASPCIATPALFCHDAYPWADKTPEASPICWGRVPQEATKPVISRELLRSACEPFFDQMLKALQQALQEQKEQQERFNQAQFMPQERFNQAQFMPQATTSACFQTVFNSNSLPVQDVSHLDLDDNSTEADEFGAFASLLSGSSSDSDGGEVVETDPPATYASLDRVAFSSLLSIEMPATVSPSQSLAVPHQLDGSEKSIMVCRHWKSKGYCRLESQCKFLHPEHKRGSTTPKGCNGKSNGDRPSMSVHRDDRLGMSTVVSLSDSIVMESHFPPLNAGGRKKRMGRDRSQVLSKEQAVTCWPCASIA